MIRPSTATTGSGSGPRGPIPFRALALLTLAATACFPPGDDLPAHTVADSAGITIVTSTAPAWAPGEEWTIGEVITSIGAVDGPPESQLFRVASATRLDDGTIVVNNRGTTQIRLYGPDGAWVRSIGGPGQGPGEFNWIDWFAVVPPDTLLVKDGGLNRVTWFTLDGRHLESRAIRDPAGQQGPRGRLADGRFHETAGTTDPPGSQPGHVAFATSILTYREGDAAPDTVLRGPAGEGFLVESVVTFNGQTHRGIANMPVPFGTRRLTAYGGDGTIALSDGGEYDIRVVTPGGQPLRVRRPIERRRVGEGDADRWVEDLIADYPDSRRAEVRQRFREIPASPLMPTHTALHVDAGGNLWIENFRTPGSDAPRAWSVHDSDGRWLGDVVLPDGLEVFEIGDDYVLGRERDEFDVEYVRAYRLEKELD